MKTTLVVMAAGIGSRFGGGIKQLEPIGPGKEIIMDYSIYDAMKAGFEKVVFIIRKDLEKDFKEVIGDRISKVVDVDYAYQELSDLPAGYSVPDGRKKPWGTGQAVLTIMDKVHEPFAVINADDYYGAEGFKAMHTYMTTKMQVNSDVYDMCMAGFILGNTLSENGGVTRGVCDVDSEGNMIDVTETYEICMKNDGSLSASNSEGNAVHVEPSQYVSMNMWGLPPAFLSELKSGFPRFLDGIKDGDIKSEYLLPMVIDELVKSGKAKVKVLPTNDKWFGVTYKEDKQSVVDSMKKLIAEGKYPEKLY